MVRDRINLLMADKAPTDFRRHGRDMFKAS